MLSDSALSLLRNEFPIFKTAIYLNSCSQGALSHAVEHGIREYIESWHELGSPWELWTAQYETARQEFADFIGAEADEVAVVASVSAGVSSLATSFDFRDRADVLMGAYEFPTMGHIWLAQQRRGARVRFLEPEQERIPATAYARAISDETLIVPVTGVCFMNGFRSEVPPL